MAGFMASWGLWAAVSSLCISHADPHRALRSSKTSAKQLESPGNVNVS